MEMDVFPRLYPHWYSRWSDLPDHLMERVMECLPVECFFSLRVVCKKWKNLLSSAHFDNIARRHPYLILCVSKTKISSLIYSFSTQSWRKISLSFLKYDCAVNFRGSASGFLLFDIPTRTWFGDNNSAIICVCNPLRSTCFRLPSMISTTSVMAKAIIAARDNIDEYNVCVVGKSSDDLVVLEKYNSITNSWKVSAVLPEVPVIRNGTVVICNSKLFFLTRVDGVMMYNIDEGTFITLPMPAEDNNSVWWRLITCKSRVIMVGAVEEDYTLRKIVIWELLFSVSEKVVVKENLYWNKIGRTPQSVREEFRRSSCSNWFECVGVGDDKICVRAHGSTEVLVYDLGRRRWSWLSKFAEDFRHLSATCLPLEASNSTSVC